MKLLKYSILTMLAVYVFWLLTFVVQKPLFMLWYRGLYASANTSDYLQVVWHGLPLDLSLAAYLTVIPSLIIICKLWKQSDILRLITKVYFGIAASLVAMAFMLNTVLYDYWSFPLDSTPLFYFFSSPKDAFASATPELIIGGLLGLATITFLVYWGISKCFECYNIKVKSNMSQRVTATVCLLVLTSLLFVPIRGGFTVAALNTGRVYYSEHQELNHAAVNPLFSLMESLAHQEDFASQYRFMNAGKASQLFSRMTDTSSSGNRKLLTQQRPNIYIVILESFSSHLMATLGGAKDVAVNLDKYGQEGILFTNIYANSFRTDRGVVSILSGFPAQPTMSIMKFPNKTASLTSLAKSLKSEDYETNYYYGGDVNFTNMHSYLVNQGYDNIVSDVDFSIKDRMSKWGVPDHLLFERFLNDVKSNKIAATVHPQLCILQTSSSHEPYDVPFSKHKNERLNAFAYTDDCIGKLVEGLRALPSWKNTLIVFVPDHQGCWPQDINPQTPDRYKIPIVMIGGAIKEHCTIETIGSQHDIAATLLGQLDIDHSDFVYSKDLLNPNVSHFSFFTFPDLFGMISDEGQLIYDNKLERIVYRKGSQTDSLLMMGKAYLQSLYDDIASK